MTCAAARHRRRRLHRRRGDPAPARAGHQVTVLDDLSTGHADAVPDGATFVPGDIAERAGAVLADGAVRRGAALRGQGAGRRVGRAPGAVLADERRRHARAAGRDAGNAVPRLVFSSTAATYGEPDEVPIVETAPTRPTNPYGASKLAVDMMITSEALAHGLGAASLRYFNVAGASGGQGERHSPETHIIPIALQVAPGGGRRSRSTATDYPTPDGTCIRDYVHVDDLAEAHLLALAAAAARRAPDLQPRQRRRFLRARRGRGGPPGDRAPDADRGGPRRPGDPAVLVASSAKIREELGWAPAQARRSTRWSPTRGRSSSPADHERGARARRPSGDRPSNPRGRRRLAGTGPAQPDRRAHRLQRRLRPAARAAVRDDRDGRPPAPTACWRCARPSAGRPSCGVADLAPGRVDGWAAYVAGVVWALGEAGHDVAGGFDVAVDSDVPEGAGLSSSAALECAVAGRAGRAARPRTDRTGAGPARPAGRERLRRRPDAA